MTLYRRQGSRPSPWKRNAKKQNGFTVEDGKVRQVQLHPIELGQQLPRSRKGKPALSDDMGTLQYLQTLSEPFGTVKTDHSEDHALAPY